MIVFARKVYIQKCYLSKLKDHDPLVSSTIKKLHKFIAQPSCYSSSPQIATEIKQLAFKLTSLRISEIVNPLFSRPCPSSPPQKKKTHLDVSPQKNVKRSHHIASRIQMFFDGLPGTFNPFLNQASL